MNFFKKATIAATVSIAVLGIAGCSKKEVGQNEASTANKVYKMKLAATWGQTLSPLIDSPNIMAKLVNKMSNGRLQITVDAANKHKSPLGVFDMVKNGNYDMAHTTSFYYKGKDENLVAFTTRPFGMTTLEQYAWFYHGGGLELMQEAYDKHNILAFLGGNMGFQMGGWFREEIKSLKDLDGLKMRITGLPADVITRVGVNAVNTPMGEAYTALETGVLDAVEFLAPGLDINMGFHKVAPYYYTALLEPAAETHFFINKDSFAKLPADLQEILKVAMKTAAKTIHIKGYDMNAVAWNTMLNKYPDIKVRTFPKEIVDAMKVANKEIIDDYSSKNSFLKKVFESQDAYLKKARAWTKISDFDYLKANIDIE